jgi:7,8-dihydro-6-hydroxymethylpterin-pyrophosphokinase
MNLPKKLRKNENFNLPKRQFLNRPFWILPLDTAAPNSGKSGTTREDATLKITNEINGG